MPTIRIAILLGVAFAMTGAASPPASLSGVWGARGAMLTVGADGARLEQDCASGSFGPVHIDAHGRFKTTGRFETFQPGPQRADVDEAPGGAGGNASFDGVVQGNTLRLTVHPAGAPAHDLTLTRGMRVKLIRCY